MSGALKHFLDTVYYVCADDTRGLPYGLYVHGNEGLEGAVRSVTAIADGLGWRRGAAPVQVLGPPDRDALAACTELGGVLAAGLSS